MARYPKGYRMVATFTCQFCGQEKEYRRYFYATSGPTGPQRRQKYCSRKCASLAPRGGPATFTCRQCGQVKEYTRYFNQRGHSTGRDRRRIYCSPECSADAQRTGSYIDRHGYRILLLDGQMIPEHRRVMESAIGRPLRRDETVHHKNGERQDNRPENLELWDSRHPMGQRVEDKIDWAILYLHEHGFRVTQREPDYSDSEPIPACGLDVTGG